MLKKLQAVFDTPEGVFLVAGLLWALGGKYLGWTVDLNVAGFGHVSAAMLITGALGFVLVSLGWKPPFQPATIEQIINRQDGKPSSSAGAVGIIIALFVAGIALLFAPLPARAADKPITSFSRASITVDAGAVEYDFSSGVPVQVGFRIAPALGWSLSQQLSVVGKAGFDVTYGRQRYSAGLRTSVLGFHDGDRVQAGLMFDKVWYEGDGAGAYAAAESYAEGVAASLSVLQDKGRDVLWLKPQVSYDNLNGWEYFIGLGYQPVGGKQ